MLFAAESNAANAQAHSGDDAASAPQSSSVAQVQFDDQFLQQPGGTKIDFSRFNKGNPALPGVYRADLYANETWLGRADVNLQPMAGNKDDVQVCFDREMLERIGVDLKKLSPESMTRLEGGNFGCVPLPQWVKDATAVFDSAEQRLDVTVPQVALDRSARGYVDPKYWDEGVPAAKLQYNASSYRSSQDGSRSFTQSYLGLNGGVNVGPWRFNHSGSLNSTDQSGTSYQSVQTYLQRSLPQWKSQFLVGDGFTDGSVFDSVGFRGAQVASDDRMYPESQRGYAPVVRGIANSNARVQIRQNGNVIYETTVAPGAFEINDLYPTGYGGDLEVVVTEADGRVLISKVPYAAAVNSLRPGISRYNATVGQYRNASQLRGNSSKPTLYQGTFQHGFTNLLTGYGGLMGTSSYTAAVGGIGLNTDLGAIGFDLTHARTQLRNEPDRNGQSARIAYSKLIEPTNTNFSLAAYRYSSRGYLGLSDAVSLQDLDAAGLGYAQHDVQKGRPQLVLNQALPQGYGSFYLTGSRQNYWNRDGADTQFQVGYSNTFRQWLNYGVSAGRQYNTNLRRWDNTVLVSLSIPLGSGTTRAYATTNLQRQQNGSTSLQQSVSGTAGENYALSYGLNASHTAGRDGVASTSNGGGNLSYALPMTTVTANASKGSGFSQVGVGASGMVVAYGGGVVLAPTGGDTVAIVEAKDAAGASVSGAGGLKVDRWGHAVVPSLVPFAANTVDIDPKGLPLNVELKATDQRVVPTAGAVVLAKFETRKSGRAAIIRASDSQGEPLPFGVDVLDAGGDNVGVVAQGGRIVALGLKRDHGTLTLRWGDDAASRCQLDYTLPPLDAGVPNNRFTVVDAVCR